MAATKNLKNTSDVFSCGASRGPSQIRKRKLQELVKASELFRTLDDSTVSLVKRRMRKRHPSPSRQIRKANCIFQMIERILVTNFTKNVESFQQCLKDCLKESSNARMGLVGRFPSGRRNQRPAAKGGAGAGTAANVRRSSRCEAAEIEQRLIVTNHMSQADIVANDQRIRQLFMEDRSAKSDDRFGPIRGRTAYSLAAAFCSA